jgi:broad specificity phosphatase PhoE
MTPNEKQWYIFRHGLATHSKNGYGDRILTAEVLPEGIPAVRRLGEHMKNLPYDYGVRSEFLRCEQTAAIVTEITGRTFVTDARLNEQYQESFEQVRERVRSFVEEMSQTPYQYIWVCTHGIVISALKNFLTIGEFSQENALQYTQPGELMVINGTDARVTAFM